MHVVIRLGVPTSSLFIASSITIYLSVPPPACGVVSLSSGENKCQFFNRTTEVEG